jgi:hypothetical protein
MKKLFDIADWLVESNCKVISESGEEATDVHFNGNTVVCTFHSDVYVFKQELGLFEKNENSGWLLRLYLYKEDYPEFNAAVHKLIDESETSGCMTTEDERRIIVKHLSDTLVKEFSPYWRKVTDDTYIGEWAVVLDMNNRNTDEDPYYVLCCDLTLKPEDIEKYILVSDLEKLPTRE